MKLLTRKPGLNGPETHINNVMLGAIFVVLIAVSMVFIESDIPPDDIQMTRVVCV